MVYSLIGYIMVALLVVLLLKGKASPLTLFIILPIVAAAILGFSVTEIGDFAVIGVQTTMSNAVLFIFSILYFGIMNDAGMFDGLIDSLVKKAGTNVVAVTVVTALISTVGHLDGATATTVLVTIPAMLPIYKKLNIRPYVLIAIIASAMGVMNLLPWGGPTARTAVVLGMDANAVWQPLIPIQIAGLIFTVLLAIILGNIEKKRGAGFDPSTLSDAEIGETKVDEKVLALKRPHLAKINIILTALVIIILMLDKVQSYVVFMLAFAIAIIINYPDVKEQGRRFKAHAPSALLISATMITSGIFVGVIQETGMLDAMAQTLLNVVPSSMGSAIHIIMGVLALPIGMVLGTDAYFYGLLPLVIEVGKTYGVEPMNVAITMIIGKNVALLVSPLVPATFLAIGLADIELKDHIKFSFKWLWGVSICMLIFAVVIGLVQL
ncbi:citrate:H+ symporter [Candidatus Epulonipiscium fishelsonii]|uniref:Citrate:H+ symporter n=1 Tax=Candidatus Epulonipiscium fishelsonii TaxID=77094 RepID=A0ACC8XBQ3_9FIRM|nr:citrate:H+ symporter [Epulopiscium sp. SCG-B05WGA-EpuloA1]ONI39791.1 citrate:H+ symporter [Epulopiscium sp. SCG-B11WGA-EpuloA1]